MTLISLMVVTVSAAERFMSSSMTSALCAKQRLVYYWLGPVHDKSMVGLLDK